MSQWASAYIEALKAGRTVEFRPLGRSMEPHVRSGQLVRVEPIARRGPLVVGDIVLCEVGPHHYLHLIKKIGSGGFLIGNNKGGVNGWIGANAIHGRLAEVIQ